MEFDKLTMDPVKKNEIMNDLGAFKDGKKHYERVGKAWKRGYLLLHGPPGTGKSAMIAAMANHLQYDVYAIELTSVRSNSDLQKLLMEVKNKTIVVIEDIDCSLDLTGVRQKKKRPAEDGNDEKNGASASAFNLKAAEADFTIKVTLSGLF
ncbi:putative mitochondrial chaperone BCS1-B [Panicum miliaceum]|uniref:Mitochondrial chaperone BCS1-B n=1 Tax=Panicum miliaceum TaxID=4540 RepID=A0A3L6TLE1_PANMI|nr:putative mitochondrial chaperone BCS1-B [Panicum miliaceum]